VTIHVSSSTYDVDREPADRAGIQEAPIPALAGDR
jgi:hypothetical protein